MEATAAIANNPNIEKPNLPPKHWDTDKMRRYRDEARCILNQLGEANKFLAQRLKVKIEGYRQYKK